MASTESGSTTDTPDSHGGNIDCRKVVKGSILYLPVNVDGALLSMGDLHALMGDGEVFICGLSGSGSTETRANQSGIRYHVQRNIGKETLWRKESINS